MKEHFQLFGFRVSDIVTGFRGVVTSINFDLYGCVQGFVTPPVNDKGEVTDGKWFDMNRLVGESSAPVMPIPEFNVVLNQSVHEVVRGAAEKPSPASGPTR